MMHVVRRARRERGGHWASSCAVMWDQWGLGGCLTVYPPDGEAGGEVVFVLQIGPVMVHVVYRWIVKEKAQ